METLRHRAVYKFAQDCTNKEASLYVKVGQKKKKKKKVGQTPELMLLTSTQWHFL